MKDWTSIDLPTGDLTQAELFELIRDAVITGNIDSTTMVNTGRADQIRSMMNQKKDLPPIVQING